MSQGAFAIRLSRVCFGAARDFPIEVIEQND